MPEDAVTVVTGVEGLEPEHGPLFAVIGVFDGIHLGHQYLLRHLVSEARERAARPAVITFDSHPDEILVGAAPPLLVDASERLRLLGEAGVEVIIVQHFDAALRMTEYDEFLHRITARTRLAGLLMTPDAAFGHDRRGTPDAVAELGRSDGFDLVVAPPFEIAGRSVRSSDIRSAIASGDLGFAAELLGRPYAIVGTTIENGFMQCPMPVALPPAGSYRTVVECHGASDTRRAALDVGVGASLRVHPPGSEPDGTRIKVAFQDG
ncbi:MAG TPA: FAD synthetase family protein [Candidatus Dormibacteraeota bacterium]|nr:FAD synthetase family protein [Candidatus Dormibacteraeota bacterium]